MKEKEEFEKEFNEMVNKLNRVIEKIPMQKFTQKPGNFDLVAEIAEDTLVIGKQETYSDYKREGKAVFNKILLRFANNEDILFCRRLKDSICKGETKLC